MYAHSNRSPTTSSGGAACVSHACTLPHAALPAGQPLLRPNSGRLRSAEIAAFQVRRLGIHARRRCRGRRCRGRQGAAGTARAAAPRSSLSTGPREYDGSRSSRCSASKLSDTEPAAGTAAPTGRCPARSTKKTHRARPAARSAALPAGRRRSARSPASARPGRRPTAGGRRRSCRLLALSNSGGMLPGCWVTSTAPSPYLRPSFTHETKGLSSAEVALGASTVCASSTTAIHGTISGFALVNSR